jgi:hypothetical protein
MNFKTLTITIVIAASLAALASMPLTATPVYAGGNVKVHNQNHQNNIGGNVGDSDQSNEGCIGNEITNSCNVTTTPGGGGGGGGGGPPECKPKPNANPPVVCP